MNVKIGTTLVTLDNDTIEVMRDDEHAQITYVVRDQNGREKRLRFSELDMWSLIETSNIARRTIANAAAAEDGALPAEEKRP